MGDLWGIAQRHMDAFGVRAAALARRMGTSPQTLSSWKQRGVHQLPSVDLLEALARETRTPYGEVLAAALRDAGYLPKERDGHGPTPTSEGPLVARVSGGRAVGRQGQPTAPHPRRPPDNLD